MKTPSWLKSISPLADRLSDYRREYLVGDLVAGVVVAIMLVPQAMAYAMLAGLPPQVGLYASIVPLFLYSLFGSSNSLAVGPVAMVSLLVLSGVGELAVPGSAEFLSFCLTLALLVGALQIVMRVFRMGFLVNFISHPVLIGFTSAAAIVIGFSQAKHLFGITVERGDRPLQMIAGTFHGLSETNPATALIGLSSCGLLLMFAYGLVPVLKRLGLSSGLASTLSKMGPLVVVAVMASVVYSKGASAANVAIVGEITAGLPRMTLPNLSWTAIQSLMPLALVITLVGYLESISVARALASRRREKVDANRELFALGMANVGAAFTGGYPVTGGFSRSLVNYSAGVRTPLGSVITASLVAVSVAFLTPLFYYIPKAVLAAIIVIAVISLVDLKTPFKLWSYSRQDAVALVVTFASVLAFGIETGILVGVGATIVSLMWKLSRPHIAIVGRLPDSEHFRNVARHAVLETEGVLVLRIDESLNFANASFLESFVLGQVAERPTTAWVLLVGSGINDIDSTGIETLETIHQELNSSGVELALSDFKGPVVDRLSRAGFENWFSRDHLFLSAHQALARIAPANEIAARAIHGSRAQHEKEVLHDSV